MLLDIFFKSFRTRRFKCNTSYKGKNMEVVESKLDMIISMNIKQQEQIDALNRHMMSLQESVRLNTNAATQTLTYIKRIQPYIEKAMMALHTAFRMVGNGIFNLREEQSEFAGNAIDMQLDTRYV